MNMQIPPDTWEPWATVESPRELFPLVYHELRKLAAQQLAREKPGQTLQATALVHEAYLRLVNARRLPRWDSRAHFLAAAADVMRCILVEQARRKKRIKRGGELQRRELADNLPITPELNEDIIALDMALDRLMAVDPQAVQLVHLRYFAGCSLAESARLLGISPRTADRVWAFTRAWLHREIMGVEAQSDVG